MHFLHDGRPAVVRNADYGTASPERRPIRHAATASRRIDSSDALLQILGTLIPSARKEWVIRQYDHEVQGGSVIKPLVGVDERRPARRRRHPAGARFVPASPSACGINPRYGDSIRTAMAAAAIDEAVRNVVAVGADPQRIAILDNFCWGNIERPGSARLAGPRRRGLPRRRPRLRHAVHQRQGQPEQRLTHGTTASGIDIPPTLLISALGQVPDVRQCVTMDLKEPGNVLYLVGITKDELGGSHYHLVTGQTGGEVPRGRSGTGPRSSSRRCTRRSRRAWSGRATT